MGAAKGGGSKKGAIGAVVGSLIGAIVGSGILLFPLGTIAGSVVGAAIGTMIIEKGVENKTWADTTRAGKGAALGRLAATVGKTTLALIIALVLIIAVLV
jgi:uncharacterized protein YqgC (DUF456 family)